MTAANENSVNVSVVKLVNHYLQGISREIPTRYVESLQYDYIFGSDSLRKFGDVDSHTSMCSLPGREVVECVFPWAIRGFYGNCDGLNFGSRFQF